MKGKKGFLHYYFSAEYFSRAEKIKLIGFFIVVAILVVLNIFLIIRLPKDGTATWNDLKYIILSGVVIIVGIPFSVFVARKKIKYFDTAAEAEENDED